METEFFSTLEATAKAAKGEKFTGWHGGNYFIGGTCARRIGDWIQRPGTLLQYREQKARAQ